MKATPIPQRSRNLVMGREAGRCIRCGSFRGAEWHHRRGRAVRDDHTHCPCNGVYLCATCHREVHKHPFEARADGFIVARSVAEPGTVPVTTWYGPTLLACDGSFAFYIEGVE